MVYHELLYSTPSSSSNSQLSLISLVQADHRQVDLIVEHGETKEQQFASNSFGLSKNAES